MGTTVWSRIGEDTACADSGGRCCASCACCSTCSAKGSRIEEDGCGGGSEGIFGPNVKYGAACAESDLREFCKGSSPKWAEVSPPGPVSGRRSYSSWSFRNCFLMLGAMNSGGVRFPKTARKAWRMAAMGAPCHACRRIPSGLCW